MSIPSSGDIHALSGAYAVDALDDDERDHFERHLAECDSCREEVASLREAAALLAEPAPVAPPAHLRGDVLAAIRTVRPLPPEVHQQPSAEPTPAPAARRGSGSVVSLDSRRRRLLPGLVAAAAAVLVVGGIGVGTWQPWSDAPSIEAGPSATERVLQAADAERVVQEFPDGARATVVRSKSLNQAVIVTEDMPDAPTGHAYELWFDHEGKMIPAGRMPSGPDNTVLLSGDAASAEGVGITVEEAGSEPPAPTSDPIVVFAFQDA